MSLENYFNDINSTKDAKCNLSKISDTIYLVKISGSIDTYNSNFFHSGISQLLEKENFQKLIFDCDALHYVSSTGVGIFIDTYLKCMRSKKEFFVLNIQDRVREVFKLLGFDSQLRFISSIDETNEVVEMIFPKQVECPSCDKKLKVLKSGSFKCPVCKSIVRVDKKGDIA